MWSLERPNHTARNSYTTCISRVRLLALRLRLQAATPNIVAASRAFDLAGRRKSLHEVARDPLVGNDITAEEMGKLYTQRMARIGAPGRAIYDDLLIAPAHGRCPLCGQRQVSTLDHHLPKAHYPALAVVPLNLVPSCSDCNKAKLDSIPLTASDVSLHPYFDNIDAERWLNAGVIETQPAALRFRVNTIASWDALLQLRVENHFRTLGLAKLYASEAADELLNIRHHLTDLRAHSGTDTVRAQLVDRARSCVTARQNGWRAAAYGAWAQSDWFCGGGFEPVG